MITGSTYDVNAVASAAMNMAARGWKIVRLYGTQPGGACTCRKGRSCPSAGKHPQGNDWDKFATSDEDTIASWFESDQPINIGILLGRAGGVIDIECDGPEAEAVLREYGLHEIDTPAYSAGRGNHYLFRHEAGLPDAAVVKVRGLEVRLGGGGKAAQSVAPPSRHRSGKQYRWLPGRSPEDVPVASLPERFKKALVGETAPGGGGGAVQKAVRAMTTGDKVEPGDRHQTLLGLASKLALQCPNLDDPDAAQMILNLVRGFNLAQCDPPKPDTEIADIVRDQIAWARKQRASEAHKWVQYGLQTEGGLWTPGLWRLQIVRSDPVEYRLGIRTLAGQTHTVALTSEDWYAPLRVARRILADTADINLLDPDPKEWGVVWLGGKQNGKPVRGLQAQVMDPEFCQTVEPAPESKRFAIVAGVVVEQFIRLPEVFDENDNTPSTSGLPKWLMHEGVPEIWFSWSLTMTEVNRSAYPPVTQAEQQRLLDQIRKLTGETEFRACQPRRASETRRRLLRWNQRHIDAMNRIAAGEDPMGGSVASL
jgi:hypothetical protein